MVGGRAGKRKIAAALDKYYDTIYAMESMPERTISSPLELAIAGLLWQQARSGYDLLKVFAETAMGGFSSSPGADGELSFTVNCSLVLMKLSGSGWKLIRLVITPGRNVSVPLVAV